MPRFSYWARNLAGQKINGVMLADNDDELALTLREMGLYLVKAKPQKAIGLSAFFMPRIKRRELITFTVHVGTSIGAGIPILRALEDVEQLTTNKRMRNAVGAIMEDLRGGSSVSEALGRHPLIFSNVYVSMVKAGETSGGLDKVLEEMAGFLEWQDTLASEIRRASIYPAVVLTAVVLLTGVLLGFVFPRIVPVFQTLKVPLPFITQAIIVAADIVRVVWYWIPLGMVGFAISVRILRATEAGELIMDAITLRLPVIGGLVEKICLSRFAHHLGVLVRTGVDITRSLSIAEGVVGNAVIAQAIKEAREKVVQGSSLWRALQETGAFPPMLVRMVFVGETTGTFDSSIRKATEFYDREVPATVKKLFAVMEPVIIVLLAGIVLMVALAVFIPLYGAMGRIGRRG